MPDTTASSSRSTHWIGKQALFFARNAIIHPFAYLKQTPAGILFNR
jgi:hypothetical protein